MESVLFEKFLQTLAENAITYTHPDGHMVMLPEESKDTIAAWAAVECGWGTGALLNKASGAVLDRKGYIITPGTPTFNFFSLKRPPANDLRVPFRVDYTWFNGGDGRYQYCDFYSVLQGILGFFAFIHRLPQYANVDKYLHDGEALLNEAGPYFCPPGYRLDPFWRAAHGMRNYTQVVYEDLRPKAAEGLRRYGWTGGSAPAPSPAPVPAGEFTALGGMLLGPNVHRYLMSSKVHPHRRLARVDGIVIHSTSCRAGKSWIQVDGLYIPGMAEGWNAPGQDYPHLVNTRDGLVWQTEDFGYQAQHCYNFNPYTIGIEEENAYRFEPWKEVLGNFIRFKGKPWEQVIPKSEMIFFDGWWYDPFTDAQVLNTVMEIRAIRAAYNPNAWVRAHAWMPGNENRGDPGVLWPWEKIRAALA